MLYRVSLGQEALYSVLQGSVVFLHTPLFGSSAHSRTGGDCIRNIAKIGGYGLGSNSHSNVTIWLTATLFDGITDKVTPTEIYQSTNYCNFKGTNITSLTSYIYVFRI